MKVMYSIVYGQYIGTTKQKLETFLVFAQIKEKQDHNLDIMILEIIRRICYNFEAKKNKVLAAIQTQKKTMSLR